MSSYASVVNSCILTVLERPRAASPYKINKPLKIILGYLKQKKIFGARIIYKKLYINCFLQKYSQYVAAASSSHS